MTMRTESETQVPREEARTTSGFARSLTPSFLFLVGLVVLGLGISRHCANHHERPLKLGDQVKEFAVHSVAGEKVLITSGRWCLLFHGALLEDHELIRYVSLLQSADPSRRVPFEVLFIARETQERAAELVKKYGTSVHVAPWETSAATVQKALGTTTHLQKIVLLSPDLRVAFAADYARTSDVRQVLQKFALLDRPTQEPIPARLEIGHTLSLPALAPLVETIASDPGKNIDNRSLLMVFFSARCTSCAMGTYFDTFERMEASLRASAFAQGMRPVVVFSTVLDRNALRLRMTTYSGETPMYFALEPVPQIENVLAEPFHGHDVLVVRTDENGLVVGVDDFKEFATMNVGG